MYSFLDRVNSFVWGNGMIALLLLTGLIYTIKLKGIQLKVIPYLFRKRSSSGSNGGLSQRKTVAMALGTAMGTGNITGVASALMIGGAGAVFWMWVSAFTGMALVYAENKLSHIYSSENAKGPMAYISIGLRSRSLAVFFALMCVGASFGMGGMVQINSIACSLDECIPFRPAIAAIIIFIIIFSITSGGAKRIGSAAQLLLPAAAVLYSIACVYILIINYSRIPAVFQNIFTSAFGIRQTAGGISGFTVSKAVTAGIRRGIFSNEAGLGSSPILHSAAENSDPELQGMWSMFEVMFDTVICCTLTAVVILCAAPDMNVSTAFSSVLGKYSLHFLAGELSVFAFCTVIGWYYCGAAAFSFLSGKKHMWLFCLCYSAVAASGAVFSAKTVWTVSDIFNGLMAFPNLLALILLSGRVKTNKSSR